MKSPLQTKPETESAESASALELSVVMPCLNEADTLATCIGKAQAAMQESAIAGEVIVADNGSSDDSIAIAQRCGARVVKVRERGYGSALMAGIEAAKGDYIIMGDADDSYDFSAIAPFIAKLREGYDLVQGCRFATGGGTILPGAMPRLHRYWGNPLLTILVRMWFRAPVNDVYCGLRGFRKDFYERLQQRCTGMEFATEMIIRASLSGARITEVPITLHPDGRISHKPHLKTFRDGWRTLRFFLLCCPRWLYLLPGTLITGLGCVGYALVYTHTNIAGARLDAHTLVVSSLFVLMGYQSLLFGAFAKAFAIGERILPADYFSTRARHIFTLERGLILGTLALLGGIALILKVMFQWWGSGFGPLDYSASMRWVVPGFTLSSLGFQTLLGSFMISILGMRRK